MGYRTNEDKQGHLRTPFKRDYFSVFICPEFKKESNMDGWKYVTENGRKESGFVILKTRFQDCNLSRKQERKPDGMIERKQSFNRESKLSAKKASCLCRKVARNKERKKSFSLSEFQHGTKENHPSICTDGMK